jgi:hypothetical protein
MLLELYEGKQWINQDIRVIYERNISGSSPETRKIKAITCIIFYSREKDRYELKSHNIWTIQIDLL